MEEKSRILVVDDDEKNLRLFAAYLIPMGYSVSLAHNGIEALEKVKELPPDIILLDIMMPLMDGYEVASILKNDADTRIIPIVMVTALSDVQDRVKALEVGADDFLTKPIENTELQARVQSLLKVKKYNDYMRDHQKELEREVAKKTEQIKIAFDKLKLASLDAIYQLTRAAEYRDQDTGDHIQRMSRYAAAIARKLTGDESFSENVLYASPMHDVGKIGIPDNILLKEASLTDEEWVLMKQHAEIGANILENSSTEFGQLGKTVAMSHHEKWDGSGYPVGLFGSDIPLIARIIALADVFDALTSKRPYKEAFSTEYSFKVIEESAGKHFDPDVVHAFFSIIDEILEIKNESGEKKKN